MHRGKGKVIIVMDPEMTIKTVCGKCNHGWMGNLEGRNIPIIGSMFQDLTLHLERDQQTIVAQWVTKTAMVLDSSRPRVGGVRFYTREECVNMGESLTIPSRTRIWLGRLDSKHLHAGGTDFLYRLADDGRPLVHSCISTFVAGHFVAQAITQHMEREFDDITIPDLAPKPGNWENKLSLIWPVERESLMWPPNATFTNGGPEGIGYLLDRFRIGEAVDEIRSA
jgi:hypothetical protein